MTYSLDEGPHAETAEPAYIITVGKINSSEEPDRYGVWTDVKDAENAAYNHAIAIAPGNDSWGFSSAHYDGDRGVHFEIKFRKTSSTAICVRVVEISAVSPVGESR